MGQSPARAYLKELHDAWDYWGSWLPGRSIRVGDCGLLRGVVFENEKNLEPDYKIRIETESSEQRWPSLELRSKSGVTITPSGSAATALGTQEFTVSFNRANGVVFGAKAVHETSMRSRGSVAKQLSGLVRAGTFPPDYVIVTDVLEAASLTAMISRSRGEAVKVRLAAPILTPIGPAALATSLEAAGSSAATIRVVGGRKATPMFKLMRAPRQPPANFSGLLGEVWRERVRTIITGPNPPRLGYIKLAADIGGHVTLGKHISVQPLPSQKIMVSSLNGEQLHLATESWGPLTIEPVDVSNVRKWLSGTAGLGSEGFARSGAAHVEVLNPGHLGTGEVSVRLVDDFPIVIEQPSGDLFLARPVSPFSVKVTETDRHNLPSEAAAPVEYVDFDSVYAATELSRDE